MNRTYCLVVLAVFLLSGCSQSAQKKNTVEESVQDEYSIRVQDMKIRDPFIYVSHSDSSYYLFANEKPHIGGYKSKDLMNWKKVGDVFSPAGDFWGVEDFWAPDAFFYQGKYYLMVTFSSDSGRRGTSVLIADNIEGPYTALENKPLTPADYMCLDATLYIDEDSVPWILYCREWLEVGDGQILAQQVSTDLKSLVSEPIVLFTASEAPWVGEIRTADGKQKGCVTDAPFIYRSKTGALLMLWSSFTKEDKYAIGLARSMSGKVEGSWEQMPEPLNDDEGGHAMLFRDLQGNLKISYHADNTAAFVTIADVVEENNLLKIKQ